MHPFTTLTAIPAPLPIDNVDTDMIIPKQFLKTIKRTGLREGLFYEMRYSAEGVRNDAFVLHNAPYDKAEILVSGANFGCGSSREHAPWALLDFGIRCVIAESFADIFFNNCFKNGMLPIALPAGQVKQLLAYASDKPGAKLAVDLEKQTVSGDGIGPFSFTVDPFRKECLLNGLDDIGLTLQRTAEIDAYEQRLRAERPWAAA